MSKKFVKEPVFKVGDIISSFGNYYITQNPLQMIPFIIPNAHLKVGEMVCFPSIYKDGEYKNVSLMDLTMYNFLRFSLPTPPIDEK